MCLVSSVCVFACVFVCVFVCKLLPLMLLITSGMIRTPYNWLNKFCNFYMATVAINFNVRGLSIVTHHGN